MQNIEEDREEGTFVAVNNVMRKVDIINCLKVPKRARGKEKGIRVSEFVDEPLICVEGKYLTPHGFFDLYTLILPAKALQVGANVWKVGNRKYTIILRKGKIDEVIIKS